MFLTLAVVLIVMVTGVGPHENRMIPPVRTAATTAAEVQLAAVPCPMTRLGWDVFTGRPAAGTGAGRAPGSARCGVDRAADTADAATIAKQSEAMRTDTGRGMPEG